MVGGIGRVGEQCQQIGQMDTGELIGKIAFHGLLPVFTGALVYRFSASKLLGAVWGGAALVTTVAISHFADKQEEAAGPDTPPPPPPSPNSVPDGDDNPLAEPTSYEKLAETRDAVAAEFATIANEGFSGRPQRAIRGKLAALKHKVDEFERTVAPLEAGAEDGDKAIVDSSKILVRRARHLLSVMNSEVKRFLHETFPDRLVIPISDDGNCLFYSLALRKAMKMAKEVDAADIRRQVEPLYAREALQARRAAITAVGGDQALADEQRSVNELIVALGDDVDADAARAAYQQRLDQARSQRSPDEKAADEAFYALELSRFTKSLFGWLRKVDGELTTGVPMPESLFDDQKALVEMAIQRVPQDRRAQWWPKFTTAALAQNKRKMWEDVYNCLLIPLMLEARETIREYVANIQTRRPGEHFPEMFWEQILDETRGALPRAHDSRENEHGLRGFTPTFCQQLDAIDQQAQLRPTAAARYKRTLCNAALAMLPEAEADEEADPFNHALQLQLGEQRPEEQRLGLIPDQALIDQVFEMAAVRRDHLPAYLRPLLDRIEEVEQAQEARIDALKQELVQTYADAFRLTGREEGQVGAFWGGDTGYGLAAAALGLNGIGETRSMSSTGAVPEGTFSFQGDNHYWVVANDSDLID